MTERKTVVARAEDGLDADRHGNVKSVAYGNAIETRRRDADNLKRITVQGQPFSNHRGVAGKISLPEGVTDVCSRYTAAGLIIHRTKQPPQNRLHAKDVKEIAADADSFRFADLAARGQIELIAPPCLYQTMGEAECHVEWAPRMAIKRSFFGGEGRPPRRAPLHWSLKAGGARVAVWAGACAGSFRRDWRLGRQRKRRSRPSASCRAPGCARRRPCWNGGCASRSPEGPG